MDYTPAREGTYTFPRWAEAVGWAIALSSLVAVLPASLAEVVRVSLLLLPLTTATTQVVRQGLPLSTLTTPDRLWRDANTNLAIKAAWVGKVAKEGKAKDGTFCAKEIESVM